VFKATREYIALLGKELADNAWISPTASHPLQGSGLDPKLPAEQMARAGEVIAQLARELADAEMADLPSP
jgi:hypothetical protein